MSEATKIWLEELYYKAIKEAQAAIRNEHMWEFGYSENDPINPHTQNILVLQDYIDTLEELIENLRDN